MNKVAIVGAQELTRDNAPYDDASYEIWGLADWICYDWLKRCDKLIEVHLANIYMNHPRTPDYWDALQNTEIPVYMYPVADPRIPNSILYPMDGVLGMLAKGSNGGKKLKPLNCTIAYAIALAIFLEYDVIDIYGVELAGNAGQYAAQVPHFAFWDGFALGRGVELNINCSDGLFVQPLYGSEDLTERARLHDYLEALDADMRKYQKVLDMTEGAKNVVTKLLYGGEDVI